MVLDHISGIFSHPQREWFGIRDESRSKTSEFLQHVPFLALIPTIAFYFGVTQVGWSLTSDSRVVYLTDGSALTLCLVSYVAALVGVWCFGEFINWMHKTYSEQPGNAHHGMAMAVYVTAPVFVAGLAGLWPNVWFNGVVMSIAGTFSVFLIYRGMPIMMNLDRDRAFLYSTSVVTVALVMLVSMRVVTALLWASGFGPEYRG